MNGIVKKINNSVDTIQETFKNFVTESEEFFASSEEVIASIVEQTTSMAKLTSSSQDLIYLGSRSSKQILKSWIF
ncbi:hypothetical protein [Candidatus Hodarchaeum mangrovi]